MTVVALQRCLLIDKSYKFDGHRAVMSLSSVWADRSRDRAVKVNR